MSKNWFDHVVIRMKDGNMELLLFSKNSTTRDREAKKAVVVIRFVVLSPTNVITSDKS